MRTDPHRADLLSAVAVAVPPFPFSRWFPEPGSFSPASWSGASGDAPKTVHILPKPEVNVVVTAHFTSVHSSPGTCLPLPLDPSFLVSRVGFSSSPGFLILTLPRRPHQVLRLLVPSICRRVLNPHPRLRPLCPASDLWNLLTAWPLHLCVHDVPPVKGSSG